MVDPRDRRLRHLPSLCLEVTFPLLDLWRELLHHDPERRNHPDDPVLHYTEGIVLHGSWEIAELSSERDTASCSDRRSDYWRIAPLLVERRILSHVHSYVVSPSS